MRPLRSVDLLLISTGMFFFLEGPGFAQSLIPKIKDGEGCEEVITSMKAAIAKEPGRLILCMEDALTTQESCTCVIVKEAVSYAGDDHALVGQIVVAAIRMVPSAATLIAECAMMETPNAAPSVRAALSKELGRPTGTWLEPAAIPSQPSPDKTADPASNQEKHVGANEKGAGKASNGKAPVQGMEEETEEAMEIMDYAWPNVGVSGIFIAPSARSGISRRAEKHLSPSTITILTTKDKPKRPVLPVTQSSPD